MHNLKTLLAQLDVAREKTLARHTSFDFDALVEAADARRTAVQTFEALRAEQKTASKGMRGLKPGSDEFIALRASLKTLADDIKAKDVARREADERLQELAMHLPNLIADEVPIGESEEDNPVLRTWGEPRTFDFDVQDHVDLGEGLGQIDFEAATRVAGARFVFLRGQIARLNRALISFMLDLHTGEHGYEEMVPPLLVNRDAMTGTGQLPKFEEDAFAAGDYFLIPTAEVPVTNYLRDTLLEALPETLKFCAYTPCFRQEAGSHGRDTRGMIRQHQFDKVEMVKFCRPEQSEAEHLALLDNAEEILRRLGLPHRTVELCSADIGFSAQRCFDIEVWLPSQNTYREISSCSNFGDFQARRAGIRYRDDNGKAQFLHTINGSGLAVGRTLVAILENYQNADGSVTIPDALVPYTGFDKLVPAS